MVEDMITDIVDSKLSPAEKLFLIAEWILRDHEPYELPALNLHNILDEVKSVVARQLPSGFLINALDQAKLLLHIKDQRPLLPLLVGLAYYSYVNSEFVYEYEIRNELMLKVSELGYEVQEMEKFYKKWVSAVGDDETLFNKIFEK